MRALGLWQPHASLVRLGIKTIETRFWGTVHRGPILICSTKKVDPEWETILRNIRGFGHNVPRSLIEDVGTMQCIVDLVDSRLGTNDDVWSACAPLFVERDGQLVQKHALGLENLRQVRARPVKCGRRWFDVADELIEVIP